MPGLRGIQGVIALIGALGHTMSWDEKGLKACVPTFSAKCAGPGLRCCFCGRVGRDSAKPRRMGVTGAAQTTAPSKMIFLDPDMDPESPHGRRAVRGERDPAPAARTAKKTAVSGLAGHVKDERIPSARVLARFLGLAQAAVRLKGEVTVLLTTDAAIRKLNRNFRGKDKATDVLSFPAEGVGAEEIAGDLAISIPTALKQAVEQGHPLATEIKVLMLHGLLHLAGYDHEADNGKMARREGILRARLGLPQGLIERAEKAIPQGLKPRISVGDLSARLKSCPDASKRSKLGSSEFADSDSSADHPTRLKARPVKAIERGSGSARKAATKRKRP